MISDTTCQLSLSILSVRREYNLISPEAFNKSWERALAGFLDKGTIDQKTYMALCEKPGLFKPNPMVLDRAEKIVEEHSQKFIAETVGQILVENDYKEKPVETPVEDRVIEAISQLLNEMGIDERKMIANRSNELADRKTLQRQYEEFKSILIQFYKEVSAEVRITKQVNGTLVDISKIIDNDSRHDELLRAIVYARSTYTRAMKKSGALESRIRELESFIAGSTKETNDLKLKVKQLEDDKKEGDTALEYTKNHPVFSEQKVFYLYNPNKQTYLGLTAVGKLRDKKGLSPKTWQYKAVKSMSEAIAFDTAISAEFTGKYLYEKVYYVRVDGLPDYIPVTPVIQKA